MMTREEIAKMTDIINKNKDTPKYLYMSKKNIDIIKEAGYLETRNNKLMYQGVEVIQW